VPHPYFEQIRFPWSRSDAKALFELLTTTITERAEIVALYRQAGGDIGVLNDNQAPAPLWHDVLDRLSSGLQIERLTEDLLAIRRLDE
jgi:hypothetical protein